MMPKDSSFTENVLLESRNKNSPERTQHECLQMSRIVQRHLSLTNLQFPWPQQIQNLLVTRKPFSPVLNQQLLKPSKLPARYNVTSQNTNSFISRQNKITAVLVLLLHEGAPIVLQIYTSILFST